MNAITSTTILPFPGRSESDLQWQMLSLSNSTSRLSQSLGVMRQAGEEVVSLSEAETRLAENAVELAQILGSLANDLNSLRSRYL